MILTETTTYGPYLCASDGCSNPSETIDYYSGRRCSLHRHRFSGAVALRLMRADAQYGRAGGGVRPRLLDLFAGAGGCSVGYHRAGFDVVGVDVEHHDDYPFELVVGDAMDVVSGRAGIDLHGFDVIHASPPCPRYSVATPQAARDSHPDLVGPVREALRAWGGTYVIENVPGAPLDHPVMLCGSAFGLRVRRHRLFESNAYLMSPGCWHKEQVAVVGVYGAHPDRPGGWLRPDGTSRGLKATSIADAQDALGIDWMTRWEDLADSIPPVMTEHIGGQLLDQMERAA